MFSDNDEYIWVYYSKLMYTLFKNAFSNKEINSFLKKKGVYTQNKALLLH